MIKHKKEQVQDPVTKKQKEIDVLMIFHKFDT